MNLLNSIFYKKSILFGTLIFVLCFKLQVVSAQEIPDIISKKEVASSNFLPERLVFAPPAPVPLFIFEISSVSISFEWFVYISFDKSISILSKKKGEGGKCIPDYRS